MYNISSTVSKSLTMKYDVCSEDEFLDKLLLNKTAREFLGTESLVDCYLGHSN